MSRKEKQQVPTERHNQSNDWYLDNFHPQGLQIDCVESFEKNIFTIVDAPSGCGKSSVALHWGLQQLRNRDVNQLIFIKNPTEAGDDKIGFLSGDEQDKLQAHMDTTKRIFDTFLSKGALECAIKKDNIRLTIPNFLLGATFDNAVVIIDETQVMSDKTVKMLLERCGKNAKYIIAGDSGQRYSVGNRNDGFKDLINRVTGEGGGIRQSIYPGKIGYIKMTYLDNMRSDGSALINKVYEDLL